MIGRKIVDVQMLNDEDLKIEFWESVREPSAVLILDDGSRIYASRDYEGNGSGALFGRKGKDTFAICITGENK